MLESTVSHNEQPQTTMRTEKSTIITLQSEGFRLRAEFDQTRERKTRTQKWSFFCQKSCSRPLIAGRSQHSRRVTSVTAAQQQQGHSSSSSRSSSSSSSSSSQQLTAAHSSSQQQQVTAAAAAAAVAAGVLYR